MGSKTKTRDKIKIKNQAIIKNILEANRIRTSKTSDLSIWGQKLAEYKWTRIESKVWLWNQTKDEAFMLSMVDANFDKAYKLFQGIEKYRHETRTVPSLLLKFIDRLKC